MKKKLCIVCLDPWNKDHKCVIPDWMETKLKCGKESCKDKKHRIDISCNVVECEESNEDSEEFSEEIPPLVHSGCIQQGNIACTAQYGVQIKGVDRQVNLFMDNGSDISFVCKKSAVELGKKVGTKLLNVSTVNGIRKVDSTVYKIPLVMPFTGKIEKVLCHTIDTYFPMGRKVDLNRIRKIFPKYKEVKSLQRKDQPCEILLGLNYYHLHPKKELHRSKHISIMRGTLGDTLIGCIEDAEEDVASHFNSVSYSYYINKKKASDFEKFIEGEELGVRISPKCGDCRCGRCPQLGSVYSFQEDNKLQLIRSGLTFKAGNDGKPGRWFCKCPWLEDPATLPENKYVALATLASTERSLNRNNLRQIYAEQIEDLKQR